MRAPPLLADQGDEGHRLKFFACVSVRGGHKGHADEALKAKCRPDRNDAKQCTSSSSASLLTSRSTSQRHSKHYARTGVGGTRARPEMVLITIGTRISVPDTRVKVCPALGSAYPLEQKVLRVPDV